MSSDPYKIACDHGFIQSSCADCNLKGLCLPIAMDLKDIDRVDDIIRRSRPIQPGEHIYRTGDEFNSIFAVRSGSIKTYLLDDEGVEQVTGFYLPGEILGFDGIGTNNHGCNMVALETSTVCEIPFERIEELALHIPILQRHFFQLMSQQIENDHKMMMTLSKKSAEGKVATLLQSLSRRYGRRNLSTSSLRLPMSRMDIGNFLGLTIETVSRTFSKLQKEKVIGVDGREVKILNMDELQTICHGTK